MNRRLVGVLVVAISVAAALAAPAGRLTAGEATAAPLPPEPVIGQCVPTVSARGGDLRGDLGADFGADPGGDFVDDVWSRDPLVPGEEASSPFGPCVGPVGGEVVLVARARGDLTDRLAVAARLSDECLRATRRITGIEAAERLPAGDGFAVSWVLSANVTQRWMVPDARARAGGRTWLACLATPWSPGQYSGTVARAYSGGRLPDQYGTCWAGTEIGIGLSRVPCGQPHRAELIGIGRVTQQDATIGQTEAACGDLAGRVMRRADPSVGGALEVRVFPEDLARRFRYAGWAEVTCYLAAAGDGRVVGTVIGLADRPLRLE